MASVVKKVVIAVLVIVVLAGAGYGSYLLYNYIVQDVTSKVRKGVSEGISEGVTDVINPLSWPKKILGK